MPRPGKRAAAFFAGANKMEVSMTTLAVGCLTAFLFGMLLWGARFAIGWLSVLLFGATCFAGRRGKVFHEISRALYIIAFTLACILFLYYINRGIMRWFLIGCMVLSIWLCRNIVGRMIHRPAMRFARVSREVIQRIVKVALFPIRVILKFAGRIVMKIILRAKKRYDKIMAEKYDRKKRLHLPVQLNRELLALEDTKMSK